MSRELTNQSDTVASSRHNDAPFHAFKMTAQPVRPPIPAYLQPAPKASSTAQSSPLSTIANAAAFDSRSTSQTRNSRPKRDAPNTDFTSEQATLSLIRRVLSPGGRGVEQRSTPKPVEELLPPLTSSNEIDLQLYAILAIVIRDFVLVWYSKITQDHAFIEEVIQIFAHCSRALEQRLRQVDIEELVLDEIPALILCHVNGWSLLSTHSAGRTVTIIASLQDCT